MASAISSSSRAGHALWIFRGYPLKWFSNGEICQSQQPQESITKYQLKEQSAGGALVWPKAMPGPGVIPVDFAGAVQPCR